jgi:hypothetical protein
MLMPIVLVIVYPKLVRLPPQGSVVLDSLKVFRCVTKSSNDLIQMSTFWAGRCFLALVLLAC